MPTIAPPSFARDCADAELWWAAQRGTARLLAGDASLWTGADEARWLGWLDLADIGPDRVAEIATLLEPVRALPADEVLLLGMGGSSLGAEVMARVLPRGPRALPLHVVDTLHPDAVLARFAALRWDRTIVVAASKSGGTLEPAVLLALARERLTTACGAAGVGRIVAVTDPGSALEQEARAAGFGALIHGRPAVGGRFSILSPFGVVPALLLDAPIAALRAQVTAFADALRTGADPHAAVRLGLAIATAAGAGRDKLTVRLPRALAPLGAWIEQLVAESLGKQGMLVLPVIDDPLPPGPPHGEDRLSVHVSMPGDAAEAREAQALEAASGTPSVAWEVAGVEALWSECFRWEVATAVAGARLGVHPFDQPDVEASKRATQALSAAWEADGVPPVPPTLRVPPVHAVDHALLSAWIASVRPRDYVGILAWLPMTEAAIEAVEGLRRALAHATGQATVVGFGPRYLHSTGQAFKGGPNTGCFLSLTAPPAADVAVPGRALSLGSIARAQRDGELEVLRARGRRVVEVTLEGDPVAAIHALADAVATR